LVVVGCSWGGLEALGVLLRTLPREVELPVVVVQHRAASSTRLATLLDRHTLRPVCDAEDKMALRPGHVYLAPPGYHLLVERGHLALSTEGPVRHSRPSIDVLFESAAEAYRQAAVGIILTGLNDDGARGLAAIASRGGMAIVQDPGTAERRQMPDAALAAVPALILTVEEMGPHLATLYAPARAADAEVSNR
jgi:two-component system chemotaxis response regulator CheB